MLKVSAAVALNEIVNAPGEFVSRSPHLVVAHVSISAFNTCGIENLTMLYSWTGFVLDIFSSSALSAVQDKLLKRGRLRSNYRIHR